MSDLVCGIGVNEGKYPAKVGGKNTREYILWRNMLLRCTENGLDKNPSYTGTTCSENFKSYTFFHEWCQEQIGFENKDENGRFWHLDKDLLTKGNKLYSEYVCVFVPHRINLMLTKSDATRGEWPVGVYLNKPCEKFIAYCSTGGGKRQHLGLFTAPQDAFLVYKAFKETLIKQVAGEYKHQLDARVYEALTNYKVDEND